MPQALKEDSLRQQIAAVLASETFRASSSLRRLLEYLGDRSLTGHAYDLKEYRIGVEGLGKDAAYDPRTDPSVRVQVGRLRSRLAEYYQSEGRSDPIVITLPKGAFSLVFESRKPDEPQALTAPLPDPAVVPSVSSRPPVRNKLLFVAAAAGVLAVAALTYASIQNSRDPGTQAQHQSAAFQALWRPYLTSQKPIVISVGVPLWLRFSSQAPGGKELSGVLRDPLLNEWPKSADSEEGKRLQLWKTQMHMESVEPWQDYLAVGEAIGAFLLGKALSRDASPSIVRSHKLSWDSAKAANIIFIGAPKFNAHLRNVPFSRNFRIGSFAVHNLKPAPGEKAAYPDVPESTDRIGAALVGRYRSPGEGTNITVVGSANSMCTWAAIEYLTRPDYVAKLTGALEKTFGRIPDFFEAVIEADFDQSSPVRIRHVVLREIRE